MSWIVHALPARTAWWYRNLTKNIYYWQNVILNLNFGPNFGIKKWGKNLQKESVFEASAFKSGNRQVSLLNKEVASWRRGHQPFGGIGDLKRRKFLPCVLAAMSKSALTHWLTQSNAYVGENLAKLVKTASQIFLQWPVSRQRNLKQKMKNFCKILKITFYLNYNFWK